MPQAGAVPAVLASCFWGARAFAPGSPGLRQPSNAGGMTLGGQAAGAEGAPVSGGLFASAGILGGVGAMTLVAAAARGARPGARGSRVGRSAGVLTYDEAGRARFVVDEAVKTAAAAVQASAVVFPRGELGVQAPTGFWDPLGFCDDVTVEEFKRLRSCEIKHGRISMLATIGYLYPFYSKLPGYLSPSQGLKFVDIPNGIEALNWVPSAGWLQIFLFAAFIEFGLGPDGIEEWRTRDAGDYDKGFLGMFGPVTDPVKKERSLNAELANGRLAMVAITGMVIQNGIVGGTGESMWYGS